jgi:thiamine-phosphate pyrophosphorylase
MKKAVVVISPPAAVNHEWQRVREMMDAGLENFHVRKPGYSRSAMEDYLSGFSPSVREKMVLHHHYELAERYGLRGIHITERNKAMEGLDRLLARHRHVSISSHDPDELSRLTHPYTYAFLSPVFKSLSKPGLDAAFSLEELKICFSCYRGLPVIALGGIHPGNISLISGMGFHGVALLGAIWPESTGAKHGGDGFQNFLQMKELVKTL